MIDIIDKHIGECEQLETMLMKSNTFYSISEECGIREFKKISFRRNEVVFEDSKGNRISSKVIDLLDSPFYAFTYEEAKEKYKKLLLHFLEEDEQAVVRTEKWLATLKKEVNKWKEMLDELEHRH